MFLLKSKIQNPKSKIQNPKSISTIIAAVILILVTIILITVVLNWSQLFTNKQVEKASKFAADEIAIQDATLMLKTELAASVNYIDKIIVKNITSNTDSVLTGYKILVSENPNDYNFLNTQINFDSEVTILAGFKNSIEIVCFPSRKFDLLLYTNQNTSDKITVNVNIYDPLSCAQYYSYLNPPTINVTELTTTDTTPDLNGLISDTSVTLSLILDGTTYAPTNDKDGTWSLTGVGELDSGSYDVNICATDTYSIVTCDESDTNELTIESDPEWSFQEDPDSTSSDGTWTNESYAFDGDWDTLTTPTVNPSNLYFNYIKPSGLQDANIEFRYRIDMDAPYFDIYCYNVSGWYYLGGTEQEPYLERWGYEQTVDYNLSLPSECIENGLDELRFRFYWYGGYHNHTVSFNDERIWFYN